MKVNLFRFLKKVEDFLAIRKFTAGVVVWYLGKVNECLDPPFGCQISAPNGLFLVVKGLNFQTLGGFRCVFSLGAMHWIWQSGFARGIFFLKKTSNMELNSFSAREAVILLHKNPKRLRKFTPKTIIYIYMCTHTDIHIYSKKSTSKFPPIFFSSPICFNVFQTGFFVVPAAGPFDTTRHLRNAHCGTHENPAGSKDRDLISRKS